ncbi:spore protease YyaC [Paenibacillus sp. JX-17]|uniref:Spore protease YyaC n=1 Tax=Paenibacillus lacisoli TaxID=3064525 RepID=A0ABT9CIQ5_9BACL|nr:spore protease YyaC [Paenibacillus sp. JX-17]MDO7907827.1 spore protease YyaC [Paenibacillus sp. JX-17]
MHSQPARPTKVEGRGLQAFFAGIHALHPLENITFLCIGTDRSTGDALGPLTGTMLLEQGFQDVIGTMVNPCDASNLSRRLQQVPKQRIVIAIDACLGQPGAVGSFLTADSPLYPAASIGLDLPAVGHYSIAAVVNEQGPRPYATLQMTSLHHVLGMASIIAKSAAAGFGLHPQHGTAEYGFR